MQLLFSCAGDQSHNRNVESHDGQCNLLSKPATLNDGINAVHVVVTNETAVESPPMAEVSADMENLDDTTRVSSPGQPDERSTSSGVAVIGPTADFSRQEPEAQMVTVLGINSYGACCELEGTRTLKSDVVSKASHS